jgi:hypothetical protein
MGFLSRFWSGFVALVRGIFETSEEEQRRNHGGDGPPPC